jgi:hypothetical protein
VNDWTFAILEPRATNHQNGKAFSETVPYRRV